VTLVVDASVALSAGAAEEPLSGFADRDLVAPPLMWSEARATLHLNVWRERIAAEDGKILHERLESLPVERRSPADLGGVAWRIADEMGWGRTYDAEYLALARLLGCRVVTLDARLRRGADRLGLVISPGEL